MVVALYWLGAAVDGVRAYRDAAAEVGKLRVAFFSMTNGRVFVVPPNDPSAIFSPELCQAMLPDVEAHLAAHYQGLRTAPDACTVKGIDHAKNHIRFLEGRDAFVSELLGWSVVFVILAAIGLVTRWVWHGFVGKPAPRRRVSPT